MIREKTTRIEKARRIFRTPGRIRPFGEGVYLVSGDSGRIYLVDFGESTCECKDHEIHGRALSCKHILAVELFVRAERLAAASRSVEADRRKVAVESEVAESKEDWEERFEQGRRLLAMFESGDGSWAMFEGTVM